MSEAKIACVRRMVIIVDSKHVVDRAMPQLEVAVYESGLRQESKELLEERTSKQWVRTKEDRQENAMGVVQNYQFSDLNSRLAMVIFDYLPIPENEFDGAIASRINAARL